MTQPRKPRNPKQGDIRPDITGADGDIVTGSRTHIPTPDDITKVVGDITSDIRPAGRPTIYSEAIASEICIRITCGDSLAKICRDEAMPGYRTVMTWLNEKPGFQQQYTKARAEQAEADADAVSDIGERVMLGEIDPAAGRVAIDARKWSAGQRKPAKYGRRVHEITGAGGGPIQTVDLTNASPEQLAALEAIFGPLAVSSDDDEGDTGGEG